MIPCLKFFVKRSPCVFKINQNMHANNMDLKLFILMGKANNDKAIVFITCKKKYIPLVNEHFLMCKKLKNWYRFDKKLKPRFILR